MKYILLLAVIITINVHSETNDNCPFPKEIKFNVGDSGFGPFDLSRNRFWIELEILDAKKKICDQWKEIDPNFTCWNFKGETLPFSIYFQNEGSEYVKNTLYFTQDNRVGFDITFLGDVTNGKNFNLKVKCGDRNIPVTIKSIQNNYKNFSKAGTQPLIKKILKKGGSEGETILIEGINFGEDLSKIFIYLYDPNPKKEDQDEFGENLLTQFQPVYLSKNTDGNQQLSFIIPHNLFKDSKDKETEKLKQMFAKNLIRRFIGSSIGFKVLVNYYPTEMKYFTLLQYNWRFGASITSILISMLLFGFIVIYVRIKKKNFYTILLDQKTGMYSISKFQAFLWTVILIGSYLYMTVTNILTGTGSIPGFDSSLIALLGISYLGTVTSEYMEQRKEESIDASTRTPSFLDLISSKDGRINLAKLQLFSFTIIIILVYLISLWDCNILEGLPTIPSTVHALLGTSQGGYIGTKAVEDSPKEKVHEANKEPEEKK